MKENKKKSITKILINENLKKNKLNNQIQDKIKENYIINFKSLMTLFNN